MHVNFAANHAGARQQRRHLLRRRVGTRCLVVGMEGVEAALDARGCPRVAAPADAEAVVVGLDTDLTYDDLRRGTAALLAGARRRSCPAVRCSWSATGWTPTSPVRPRWAGTRRWC